jgi:hypothetical protein
MFRSQYEMEALKNDFEAIVSKQTYIQSGNVL